MFQLREYDASPVESSGSQLLIFLAFGFGVVFLAALLILAAMIPNPSEQQFELFRIVIAIAVAGVAAVVPGLLNVQYRSGRGFLVSTSGALAVFFIVYFYSPAHWVHKDVVANKTASEFRNSGINYGQQNSGGSNNTYNFR